jgi:hypothetical protein
MMHPTTVGIRFLFPYGAHVTVGMSNHDAKAIMDKWRANSTERTAGTCSVYGINWAVDLSRVEAIHTIDAEQLRFAKQKGEFEADMARQQMRQAGAQIGPAQSFRPGTSGLMN